MAKKEEKIKLAEAKAAEKNRKAEEKKAARIAKLTPEQIAKEKAHFEREEAKWQRELLRGEAYRKKIQAELSVEQK